MHFLTIVALPPCYRGPIDKAVETLMAPYCEELEVETRTEDGEIYSYNPNGWWDWYQIGGRWSGHLSDYNPQTDPKNLEPCSICGGTGQRDWSVVAFEVSDEHREMGCNGCHGVGMKVSWPTQWGAHESDVARLGDVRDRLQGSNRPYHIVGCEVLAHAEKLNPDWDGKDYSKYFVPTGEIEIELQDLSDDCIVVVVDCHS